jgi:hypothetical protein
MAAIILAAPAAWGEEAHPASAVAPAGPTVMYLSGGDVWRDGAFFYGGLLWSPRGLFAPGFTLKLLSGAGDYTYRAGSRRGTVLGVDALDAITPGWRFHIGKAEITAFAGLDLQEHCLFPDDRSNALRGFHAGLRAGADVWYEVAPQVMMLAANVSASTIGPDYWTRIAAGWRMFDRLWVGPEALALGDPTYRQFRLGVHGTGFKIAGYEWSAGFGFVEDSDRRSGLYASLNILLRR